MNPNERARIQPVVERILAAGLHIKVDDGGDNVITPKTQTLADIMAELGHTDQDNLVVIGPEKKIREIALIYGNAEDGSEVIADYSGSLEDLVEGVSNDALSGRSATA